MEKDRYANLTVIATLLSGATASVLQIVGSSFQSGGSSGTSESGNSSAAASVTGSGDPDSGLAIAVNACLFSSLVISMASTAQSLLAILWIQTIVLFVSLPSSAESFRTLKPLITRNQSTIRKSNEVYARLLRQGPLLSLLVAGALFVAGLTLFMFASHQVRRHVSDLMKELCAEYCQHRATTFVTTGFAALLTLIVLILAVLLPLNYWTATRQLERDFNKSIKKQRII